jgi:hypothetical protein
MFFLYINRKNIKLNGGDKLGEGYYGQNRFYGMLKKKDNGGKTHPQSATLSCIICFERIHY